MGKRRRRILSCSLLALLLCACGLLTLLLCAHGSDLPKDGCWSEGRYLRRKNTDLIIFESSYGGVCSMGKANDTVSFDGLEDGDLIRIYIREVLETWPGQTTVYAVEKLEDGDLQDISAELLGELEEMGWLETGSDG